MGGRGSEVRGCCKEISLSTSCPETFSGRTCECAREAGKAREEDAGSDERRGEGGWRRRVGVRSSLDHHRRERKRFSAQQQMGCRNSFTNMTHTHALQCSHSLCMRASVYACMHAMFAFPSLPLSFSPPHVHTLSDQVIKRRKLTGRQERTCTQQFKQSVRITRSDERRSASGQARKVDTRSQLENEAATHEGHYTRLDDDAGAEGARKEERERKSASE